MATFTVLAQVQNWKAAEFWGFFAQKKIPKYRRNRRKISKNPKNRRNIGDFTENCPKILQIDYRWRISCRPPPITEKSAIFRRNFAKFCSLVLIKWWHSSHNFGFYLVHKFHIRKNQCGSCYPLGCLSLLVGYKGLICMP